MKLIERQYVFVNVADTTHVNYGDFYIPMPLLPEGINITNRMYIKKAIIGYDWKRVTATTNTLTIAGVNYYLTEGNPNVIDLVAEINGLQNDFNVSLNRIKGRLEWHNQHGHTTSLSTNAYGLLGLNPGTVVVASNGTYTSPNLLDVRPEPIFELRVNTNTGGLELINGQVNNTNILCAIGIDCALYATKIWKDDGSLYWTDITNTHKDLHFTMTNVHGEPIEPQSSPYYVVGFDTYLDEEKELVSIQQQALKLQTYDMLLKHGTGEPTVQQTEEIVQPLNYEIVSNNPGKQI